jgi:hypothetical protein
MLRAFLAIALAFSPSLSWAFDYATMEEAIQACGGEDNVSPLICSGCDLPYGCFLPPKQSTASDGKQSQPESETKVVKEENKGPATKTAEEIFGKLPDVPVSSEPKEEPKKVDKNPFRNKNIISTPRTSNNPFSANKKSTSIKKVDGSNNSAKKPEEKAQNPAACIQLTVKSTSKVTSGWKHYRFKNSCTATVAFDFDVCGTWGGGKIECDKMSERLSGGDTATGTFFRQEPVPRNFR